MVVGEYERVEKKVHQLQLKKKVIPLPVFINKCLMQCIADVISYHITLELLIVLSVGHFNFSDSFKTRGGLEPCRGV